ncbi:MAG: hypothetical protein WBF90_23375 [Rivularia sp. (in: cyanobacteria)]
MEQSPQFTELSLKTKRGLKKVFLKLEMQLKQQLLELDEQLPTQVTA